MVKQVTVVLLCLCVVMASPQNHSDMQLFKGITQVRDLKEKQKWMLEDKTLQDFPIQKDGSIKWVNIYKAIHYNDIEDFGIQLLGLEKIREVYEIIKEHKETAIKWIVSEWFNMSGTNNEPVTFRTLIYVLYKIGYNELADKMANTAEILEMMDINYIPLSAREFSQKLSKDYKEESVINSSQWLPKMLGRRNITFIDLELKDKQNNDYILLDNLLIDIQISARILFIGRPGVGKSTITRHISKHPIYMQHFYLVVKVHLGVNHQIGDLKALLETNNVDKSFTPSRISTISNFLQMTLGEGVCFLLDGYDEYVETKGSYDYINGLIGGAQLKKSVVIVTSRPSAVRDIENLFGREIEIIGFGEKAMHAYLEQLQLPDNESQTIYKYLDNHPSVRQMCYLPLHLSMLVYIAVETTDSSTLTLLDTETKLYNNFLALTIKQYEKVRFEQTVKSLKVCLRDTKIETDFCILLRKISEIAFEGIMNRTQMFTSFSFNGLPDSINASEKIEALSLFKVETSYDRNGIKFYKYSYSHPTFQEFLAAFHLTTYTREVQLSYTKYWWTHEMYKYYFGLIGGELKYNHETVLNMFISFAREDLATYQNQELYVMKCAHEAADGHGSQFISYLQAVDVIRNHSVYVQPTYSYDCWYLGYILAHYSLYELTIHKFADIGLCISFITKYLKHDLTASSSGIVSVKKVALGDYSYGYWPWFTDKEDPTSTTEIQGFLPTFQNSSTHLELRFLKFEQIESIIRLGEILKMYKNLQFLALSTNTSVIKEGHLESVLRDLTNLEHLELAIINKHDDDTAIPDDLLEFRNLKQLHHLSLYISWNKTIVDVNMTALIGGLQYLTSLESLLIRCTLYRGFRPNGTTELLQGIEAISSVTDLMLYLDLCWYEGLGNVSIKQLVVALSSLGSKLKKLSLCIDFNFSGLLGHIGVVELTEGLKELSKVEYLRLELRWEMHPNDTSDEAAIVLADGLKHLLQLRTLELNLQHDGSCSKITTLFKYLTQLQELVLKWTTPRPGGFIGQTDVPQLISGLQHLEQLKKLDLSKNILEDGDIMSLIIVLKRMKHLHTLDLSHNKIGDDGMKSLAELIDSGYLPHLQALFLNENNFCNEGAKVMAEKVVKLLELHTLDFGLDFGTYSAEALSLMKQQKVKRDLHLNETWYHSIMVTYISLFEEVHYSIHIVIYVLIGLHVFVLYYYYKLSYNSRSNRNILSTDEISEALSQSNFSASYAWKLDRLRNLGINGDGTVIAILDTAVDLNCLALSQKGNNILIIDCLEGKSCASKVHGTICSAVAAGLSYDTPSGVFPGGVAPGAQLIVYRIAEGGYCYNQAILKALRDVKERIESGCQIDVVSISYDCNESGEQEISRETKALTEKKVVCVAAAGNRGHYQAHAAIPACFDHVISVGALDRYGRPSLFNSEGIIDVYAPGEDIEDISSPFSTSGTVFGTSFATPAVSGLVSLLKQYANLIEPHAPEIKENIHDVNILKNIFNKHMVVKSDSGKVNVFDPVEFFRHVTDNPSLFSKIVLEHLDPQDMEQ